MSLKLSNFMLCGVIGLLCIEIVGANKNVCGGKPKGCIQCYACGGNKECDDKFSKEKGHLVPCYTGKPNHVPFCVKIQKHNGTSRFCSAYNKDVYKKSYCSLTKHAYKLESTASRPDALKFCGICEKDLCNGTNALVAALPVAFLSLMATYLLTKLL